MFHIHGSVDENIPLAGGRGKRKTWPSPLAGLEQWRSLNGCSTKKTESSLTAGTTLYTYQNCNNADVAYAIITDWPHGWPGANSQIAIPFGPARYPLVREEIWKFFAAHPKH